MNITNFYVQICMPNRSQTELGHLTFKCTIVMSNYETCTEVQKQDIKSLEQYYT